ncbi:MAG: IS1595 family transposase [Lachnospiraceae bacterium]|jgi:transposase-like protein|nr:IS1595 family transposase [Lachnospiraceae bacterium]MCH4033682.1 IS1595 family transposase [Lachnospiraceae bacterium]MCI1399030.1 IS1595 family transposase [Lachnospiraceae bacterium]
MGNIERILAAGNNLSDSDLKILVNKIMDRLNHEKAFASSVKIVPRMECPVCHTSSHVVRNGHKHGKQAFLCRACGKSYVTTSNTLLSGSHYSSDVWKTVLADTLMGVSLDDDLQHIRISHTSLFFMRHKIMLALEDLQEVSPAMVEEVVEADETYIPEPEKGTKFGPDAKRKPRKRGTPASKRGLSDEQICICTAVQRKSGDLVVKSENRARPSTEDVVDIYTGHVKKGTLFLTDGMNVYPKLGKVLGLSVMNVKKETGSFFSLNTVNNLHSFIKNRYYDYRGVATKYLNRYNMVFRAAYRMRMSVDELAEKLFLVRDPKRVHHYDDVKELNMFAV